ncbi:G-patch domain-containing protein [Podospora appendiculata]|uniref:G-patch domain-containing protein n=1 Tax=Podospora appendiculata TaxID=314037 RepID=A0AAE0XI11_9PEZI|nr:G-patch domain-containing protein [Podospora appendiculata]
MTMNLPHPPPVPADSPSDSEDDYMKMTFTDTPSSSTQSRAQPETSLQRRQRERRAAEIRGRVKSKAELAAEETAAREAVLSRSMLSDPKKSKGLAMMAKMGFTGGALGSKDTTTTTAASRVVEPIRVAVKDGREGIGLESERKRKLREAAEALGERSKRAKVDEDGYRERIRREREEARLERLVYAAQKVAEMMDEERTDGVVVGEERKKEGRNASSRPLRAIPVVWRGLIRAREEAERDRRMRHDLEQSLSRLPTYEDADEDEDDKRALGREKGAATAAAAWTMYVTAEDLDEEDAELDEFNALPAGDKLRRLVEYLRGEHRYCFWCKFAYPDAAMDGCPGLSEEDHD